MVEFLCPSCGNPTPAKVIGTRGFFHQVHFTCVCGAGGIDDIAVPVETKSFLSDSAAVVITPAPVITLPPAPVKVEPAARPAKATSRPKPARHAPEKKSKKPGSDKPKKRGPKPKP